MIDSIESKDGVAVVGGDIFTEEGRIIEAFSFYYARLVVLLLKMKVNFSMGPS
ncbi:MAG: hypothetical protein CM15mP8_1160 [Methanobacteriota archaeon]|nr:MAG: hypothetical protein CM15mP8_1160 [Euryarchaeota archaeon]